MLTGVSRELCQCCLLRLPDKDLKKCYRRFNENEVYSDMLRDCLQVQLWTQGTEVQGGICEICVMQLRDARDFKRQVEHCQKQLEEHAQKQAEMEVKKEIVEIDNDTELMEQAEMEVKKEVEIDIDTELMEQAEVEVKKEVEIDSDTELMEQAEMEVKKEEVEIDSDTELMDNDVRPDSPDFPEEPDEPKTPSLPRITSSVSVRLTRVDQKTVMALIRRATKPGDVVRAGSAAVAKASGPVSRPATADTATSDKNELEKTEPYQSKTKSKVAKAHDFNVNQLMKHSNCTPFFTKTIAGIKCCYCYDNFLNLTLYKEHMQSDHADHRYSGTSRNDSNNLSCKMDITDLKCKLCKQNFDLLSSLKEHLIKTHGVEFWPEESCFVSEFKLSDGEVMNCALCSATFETFKTLLVHVNGHYRNFICKECDMGFINKCRLTGHQRIHDMGTFKCSFCTKVFSTNRSKMSHENMVHENVDRPKKCPLCEKIFTTYYLRNRHLNEEHDSAAATTYKCNVCDISFPSKYLLNCHTRKDHLMEKSYICDECGKDFFSKRALKLHMIRHNGERIHKCTVCHKAYSRNKTLKVHMRIHNNDRRFKCELCGLAFVQKCTLNCHMKNHKKSQAKLNAVK